MTDDGMMDLFDGININDLDVLYFDETAMSTTLRNDASEEGSASRSSQVGLSTTVRHAQPINDAEIQNNIRKQIPSATMKHAQWAKKTFNEWLYQRNIKILDTGTSDLMHLSERGHATLATISKGNLNKALQHFVFEVRKSTGEHYPSESLRSLVCGIGSWLQRVEKKPWKIFSDKDFEDARAALDAAMKQTAKSGVNEKTKRASPITDELEESLWRRGYLGQDNPKKLNRTLLYLLSINLGLRGGRELRELTVGPDSELQLRTLDNCTILEYNEKTSKTNRSGLKDRHVQPKCVTIYPLADSNRCTIQLYKKMIDYRPQNCPTNALFLQPCPNFSSSKWYRTTPMGHNTLDLSFRSLMEAAGEDDHNYTNQSGRRTTVTRIVEKTGEYE
jgi:hypothetical protein